MATVKAISAKDRAQIITVVTTIVGKAMHVTPLQIMAVGRVAEVASARMICGWILLRHYRFTLEQVSSGLNRSDHSSAIHWRKAIDCLMEDSPADAVRIQGLVQRCDEVLTDIRSKRDAVLNLAESQPDVLTTSIMRIKDPERLEQLKTLITGRLATLAAIA